MCPPQHQGFPNLVAVPADMDWSRCTVCHCLNMQSKREHVAASNPRPASLTGNAHAASVPPFHVVLHVSIQVPADWSLCCVAWRRPLSSLQGLRIPERGMLFLSYDCQAFHCFPPSSKDGHLGLLAGTCTESLQPASSLQLSRK